ncbi:MAG: enoyl-CoA hydratase [Calditrichaeota bacterium]|nr:enoyl-CoA hydratase [Calditrichota bacterium]
MDAGVLFEWISCSLNDGIAVLSLNRPPVNALNRVMVGEISRWLNRAAEQVEARELRVVVLRAEGKHFCAGADLKERRNIPEEEVETIVSSIRETFQKLAELPVPVIAAIHGAALGGGLELALAADFRILSEGARVGLPETSLAIIPGAGGTQRLGRLIGYSNALYWIATARVFSAKEAQKWGVANLVVPKNDLLPTAMNLAAEIAKNGPVAVRAAKKALQKGLEVPLKEALEIERKYYAETIFTQDRLEGIRAFLEKRPPRYEGK